MKNLQFPLVSRKRLDEAWASNARLLTEVSNQSRKALQFEELYAQSVARINELMGTKVTTPDADS